MKAKIKVTKQIKVVTHFCSACESEPTPIFEGIVKDNGYIDYPIVFGYHIGFCPHCGGALPDSYPMGVKK